MCRTILLRRDLDSATFKMATVPQTQNSDFRSRPAGSNPHEFLGLIADCICVVLAQAGDLGYSEEQARRVASNYLLEVLPVLQNGPWPLTSFEPLLIAKSRTELEQAAELLRRLANPAS